MCWSKPVFFYFRSHPRIKEKLKGMLKKWAEGEFKADSALSLIPALYSRFVLFTQQLSINLPDSNPYIKLQTSSPTFFQCEVFS